MVEKEKIVWITGASSGIGKSLAEVFVRNGIRVAGSARRTELLNQLQNSLGDLFVPLQLNVSDKEDVLNVFANLSKRYFVETLINNAGITSFRNAAEDSIEKMEQIIQTNLLGSIFTTKSVLPEMIEKQSGTIINILSVVTQKIFTGSGAYTASKSGLQSFAKVLREELRGKNIRIINVSPGPTATEIWPEKALTKYSDKMMNPDDVANIIFRLFEEKSNLVTEEIVLNPITGEL